jgi:hypothetical protein
MLRVREGWEMKSLAAALVTDPSWAVVTIYCSWFQFTGTPFVNTTYNVNWYP